MNTVPPVIDSLGSETHQLYLHLLQLQGADGQPATDSTRLHREIAQSPGLRGSPVDSAALARYVSGDQSWSAEHLQALRSALDGAHRAAVDPKYTWKPRWLNTRQGVQNAHPTISSHALHHHPLES